MLRLHILRSPDEQREIFAAFDPGKGSWIVSDLRSKLDLQRLLLNGRGFLPGQTVMRVSELWRECLNRLRPDLQIVSRDFMLTYLAQKLSAVDADWVKTPGVAQVAHEYLSQLMPVLSHPDGAEMMSEWFKENPESAERWQRWYELANSLWRELLVDGFISPAWVSGVLSNEPELGAVWAHPLVIDLGAELNQVEADLLVTLSDFVDVTILKPEPSWLKTQRWFKAYDVFARKLKVQNTSSVGNSAPLVAERRYCKFTTMIAEVKDATAQVRLWLEASGCSPREIAIVAPDIEMYWPALAPYLQVEGIPVQKATVRRAHTFPEVAFWLANQRLKAGATAESDLELAVFSGFADKSLISFARFKVLYTTLYGREDLARSQEVADRFCMELDPGAEWTRDEFISWSLRWIPKAAEANLERIERVMAQLFADCPQGLSLHANKWLSYLESLAARIEITIADGFPDGVACLNLGSALNSPAKKMIVLGLTESALKGSYVSAVSPSDGMSLAARFGFHLATEEATTAEFETRWLIDDHSRELALYFAETDFAGSPQAPAWLWIEGARAAGGMDEISLPRPTRWDEIQKSGRDSIGRLRGWTAAQQRFFTEALSEDLGEALPKLQTGIPVERLSPSSIEAYLECPFIFLARYLFSLSSERELDLELDPSRRGSLMHKIFEILMEEPVRFDFDDSELDQVIETARQASGTELGDERLWASLKERLKDLARRFLVFEQESRRKFPKTKTIGREENLAGFIDPATGDLTREPSAHDAIRFVGRIDRIDTDQEGHLAIYDYKSTASGIYQNSSWLKNNKIQLLIYAIAIENGLTAVAAAPVLSALYQSPKPMRRDYGFKVTDVEQALYDINDKKKNKLKFEERQRLFAHGRARIAQAIAGIKAGDFAPRPHNEEKCKGCQWKTMCRAPHLKQ